MANLVRCGKMQFVHVLFQGVFFPFSCFKCVKFENEYCFVFLFECGEIMKISSWHFFPFSFTEFSNLNKWKENWEISFALCRSLIIKKRYYLDS